MRQRKLQRRPRQLQMRPRQRQCGTLQARALNTPWYPPLLLQAPPVLERTLVRAIQAVPSC